MPEEKRDYLGFCNSTKHPFQDFVSEWCSRCFQEECTRSLYRKSRFEQRIVNWEKALFLDVPKLSPEDPRFTGITSKRFLPVVPVQAGAPSVWLDPREIESQREYSAPSSPVAKERAPEPRPQDGPTSTPIPQPTPGFAQHPPEPVLRNTSAKPRQMIGGSEQKPSPPVLDPWQPKQPLKPDDVLVKPGGRFKFKR